MKIKNPVIISLISIIMCAIGVLGFLEIGVTPVNPRRSHQHQISGAESNRSALTSKSTTLLLLTAGAIGVLIVRRKKKNQARHLQKNTPQTASEDRDKEFVRLNKQYLNLQYKITQYKFSGENPPDCLLKEISDLERKVRLISKALE